MIHLKIAEVGGKPVIQLEETDLAALGVAVGDTVSVEAAPTDTKLQQQIALGEKLMDEHKDVFRALAK